MGSNTSMNNQSTPLRTLGPSHSFRIGDLLENFRQHLQVRTSETWTDQDIASDLSSLNLEYSHPMEARMQWIHIMNRLAMFTAQFLLHPPTVHTDNHHTIAEQHDQHMETMEELVETMEEKDPSEDRFFSLLQRMMRLPGVNIGLETMRHHPQSVANFVETLMRQTREQQENQGQDNPPSN